MTARRKVIPFPQPRTIQDTIREEERLQTKRSQFVSPELAIKIIIGVIGFLVFSNSLTPWFMSGKHDPFWWKMMVFGLSLVLAPFFYTWLEHVDTTDPSDNTPRRNLCRW